MSSKTNRKTARKTKNRKAAGTTIPGKTCLVRGNRHQFIADHKWATNPLASCKDLATAVLVDGQKLTGNWAIGPQRTEKVTGKPAKKGKKTAVVATVSTSAPAKVYRRANGTIAPKSEYAIREVLEAQGLSRKQVDKKTAKALKV